MVDWNRIAYRRSSNDASPANALELMLSILIPLTLANPCKRVIALLERSTRCNCVENPTKSSIFVIPRPDNVSAVQSAKSLLISDCSLDPDNLLIVAVSAEDFHFGLTSL